MTRNRTLLLLLAILALAAASLPSSAPAGTEERESRLYEVRHRFAGDLLPVAESLMGVQGSATQAPGSNAILLVGPREDIARTLRVLLMQDRVLAAIVVRYTMQRLAEIEAAGVEIRWSVDSGKLRIGSIVPPPPGDSFAMKAHAAWRREQLAGGSELRMLEGGTAKVETGTALPYPSAGSDGRDGGVSFATAGTGVSGSARVLGDGRVRLAIAPLLSSLGADGVVHSTSAETTLELAPGEVKVLGGIGAAAGTRSSSLAHERSRAEGVDDLVLLVSVEVE